MPTMPAPRGHRIALLPAAGTVCGLAAAGVIPFPIGPARVLPSIDGAAFPPYRVVFQQGECTANDGREQELPGGGGATTINTNKTCFSCFRIPTLLGGQTPGVIHAFAEGRRGELIGHFHQYTGSGAGGCPDGPDTRLVYKRSADYGMCRAENGRCQSQASPVIDPVTKTLIVGFISNGPGCQGKKGAYLATPTLVNSTDDGLTWSAPYPLMLDPPVPVAAASHFAIGPTKGLTVRLPNGGIRLQLPGEADWSAAVFSDDHGKTWQSNAGNRSFTLSPGEMDWTICPTGSSCPAGMKYIM
eukprot:gene31125-35532_t